MADLSQKFRDQLAARGSRFQGISPDMPQVAGPLQDQASAIMDGLRQAGGMFEGMGDNLMAQHNRLIEAGDVFSSMAKSGVDKVSNLASGTMGAIKDAVVLDEEVAGELNKQGSMNDFFENMTPNQFTALQAVSTGLQTLGGLESIGAAEKATLSRMQQQYQLDLDNIEFQEWMGENVRQIAEIESLVTELKAMESQAAGPVQQQQFIRDPRTGVTL